MELIAFRQTPAHLLWCADEQVHGKRSRNCAANLTCLTMLVPGPNDNQNVHVAIGLGGPIGVRAEKDDLFGLEALRNLAREATDDPDRDVGAPKNMLRSG